MNMQHRMEIVRSRHTRLGEGFDIVLGPYRGTIFIPMPVLYFMMIGWHIPFFPL